MTAMTKTARRAVNNKIRTLQRERRSWLSGRIFHEMGWWGIAWCRGPGSPGHQEPVCEGCGTVAWARDEAAVIAERIRLLRESLEPAVQGGLW